MVPTTYEQKVSCLRRAAIDPVVDVVGVEDPIRAPREHAGLAVPGEKDPTQSLGDGPVPRAELDLAVWLMDDLDHRGVARQAAALFCGTLGPPFDPRLTVFAGILEDVAIDVDHDHGAIPTASRPRPLGQRTIRDLDQCIRALGRPESAPLLLPWCAAGGFDGAHEQRALVGREPGLDQQRAVLVEEEVGPPRFLAILGEF